VRQPPEDPADASVRGAIWPDDLDTVRGLFRGYRQWLADHQDPSAPSEPPGHAGLALVDRLIAELPGAYGPPRGEVLFWSKDDTVVACGALRELEPKVGEIKRIQVSPELRGKAFGRPFVRALVNRARGLGFERLRVDTLPTMRAAIEFYQEAGFRRIGAYWPHPVPGALFFELELAR
jgi:ribosomal protein S18 acetylase RimI-like enzyme